MKSLQPFLLHAMSREDSTVESDNEGESTSLQDSDSDPMTEGNFPPFHCIPLPSVLRACLQSVAVQFLSVHRTEALSWLFVR